MALCWVQAVHVAKYIPQLETVYSELGDAMMALAKASSRAHVFDLIVFMLLCTDPSVLVKVQERSTCSLRRMKDHDEILRLDALGHSRGVTGWFYIDFLYGL